MTGAVGVRVKICGLTRPGDARMAARHGASFLGLVFADSPRRVDLREARSWLPEVRAEHPGPRIVGVFLRPDASWLADIVAELALDLVQVHGLRPGEAPRYPVPWIRALSHEDLADADEARIPESLRPWATLVDAHALDGSGGTGRTFPWSNLDGKTRPSRLFLAGGLGPDNVLEAIRTVHPWAVDVASRLEIAPGRKDPARITAFFAAVSYGNSRLPPTAEDADA